MDGTTKVVKRYAVVQAGAIHSGIIREGTSKVAIATGQHRHYEDMAMLVRHANAGADYLLGALREAENILHTVLLANPPAEEIMRVRRLVAAAIARFEKECGAARR